MIFSLLCPPAPLLLVSSSLALLFSVNFLLGWFVFFSVTALLQDFGQKNNQSPATLTCTF